jgi:Trypsin
MRVRPSLFALSVGLSLACAETVPTEPASPIAPQNPSLIRYGEPDAGRHPYVVLLAFRDAAGTSWLCSGALLSSTVVLTAGHCTEDAIRVSVYPSEVVVGGTNVYPGVAHTYEQEGVFSDLGIVVLTQPIPTSVVSEYAELPTVGLADQLSSGSPVDVTGYGVNYQVRGGGPPEWDWTAGVIRRMYAPTTFVSGKFAGSGSVIRLTANPGGGKGGICFGDSGGPDLIGGTDIVIGVNSFVMNTNCAGVTYSYRIDSPETLAWIQSFL